MGDEIPQGEISPKYITMSIFPTHDISLNRYYYSFYSYNPSEDANVIKSFTYDNTQTLVETKDISFNTKSPTEMITFLENSGTNPYAVGKSGAADFRSMDLAFGGVYKKGFKETQRQALMTYLNTTYKNIHAGAVQEYAVTVSNHKYYLDGNGPAYTVIAPTSGIYVFDQSDSTNVTHPLVIGETDGAGTGYGSGTYYSSMITEGTIGSLNGYTIVDISAGTPDLYYYCSAHSGMGGQILNFMSATVTSYTVTVVNSVTHGQNIFAIDGSTDYYDAGSLVFNAGTKYTVNVSALNDTSYDVVFGTTIDDSSSIVNDTSIVTKVGDIICILPQQTLYMFDRNIEYMTKPLTLKNYMFKTSGTLTLQMTTPTVNYYLINGGGGGGAGYSVKNVDPRGGQGGFGGKSITNTHSFLQGSYTIKIGSGLSGRTTNYIQENANSSSSNESSIVGQGINVVTNGVNDTGRESHGATKSSAGLNGRNGYTFGFGAQGGGGGITHLYYSSYTQNAGSGGQTGGGNGSKSGNGANGQANTGSGGGGGASYTGIFSYDVISYNGGNGGSGVVIIRLPEGKFSYTGTYNETTLEFP